MSITTIRAWDKEGRLKAGWDQWFVYTAYAPMDESEVLIKVGISTVPFTRFGALYCNSPFPLEYAAFTPVGRKGKALTVERRVLANFAQYKTRGEWIRLPMTAEMKNEFAAKTRAVVTFVTGKPVEWTRVSAAQIRAAMSSRMREMG